MYFCPYFFVIYSYVLLRETGLLRLLKNRRNRKKLKSPQRKMKKKVELVCLSVCLSVRSSVSLSISTCCISRYISYWSVINLIWGHIFLKIRITEAFRIRRDGATFWRRGKWANELSPPFLISVHFKTVSFLGTNEGPGTTWKTFTKWKNWNPKTRGSR